MSSLTGLQRILSGGVDDLRSILDALRVLPRMAAALDSINAHVANLDEEVTLMRRSVESLGGEVRAMGSSVEPLEERLSEVTNLLRPWRRNRRVQIEQTQQRAGS